MDIQNPRRILILGAPDSGALSLLKDLTGSAPTPVDNSIAGLSHEYRLSTRYYTATLPIWLDEITDAEAWRAEFVKPEAREVIQAIGGWIYCFRRPVSQGDLEHVKSVLKAISDVIERGGGYGWEGVRLAAAMAQSTTPYLDKEYDEWDELCGEHGFEYIDSEAKGRNEYGEPTGIERLKEALAANDWAADLDDAEVEEALAELDLDGEDFNGTFAAEEAEINMEFFNMKTAINEDVEHPTDTEPDEAAQVEEMERMMVKMQAVKDMGSSMPEEERKKFAAKAVADFMKNL